MSNMLKQFNLHFYGNLKASKIIGQTIVLIISVQNNYGLWIVRFSDPRLSS